MRQVVIAVDQLFNTLIGGYADETLSARCWRNRGKPLWGFLRVSIDILFFWDSQHCYSSYISEFTRRHLPREYRK